MLRVLWEVGQVLNTLYGKWSSVCDLQEGYWELTTELGECISVDVDRFANVFLKSRGIQSLGENSQDLFQALIVETAFQIMLSYF